MGSNAGRTKNFRSGFRLPFSTTGMFLIILLLTCTLVCLINFKTYSHPTRHSRESFNSQTVASRYGQLFTNLAVKFWEDYKTNDKDRNFRLADKVGGGVYCEPVEFLTSMDPSLGSLDPRALCEGMSGHSDVLCRVYLHQIGVRKTEIHEDACVLQGSATKVPKIVYFVTFGSYEFQMRNYVAVLAAKRHIDPQAIYVIGDQHPTGPWWELVIRDVPGIRFVYREAPLEIAGYRIKKKEHRSDVIRLQMLYLNGGIYLDTDMVVLRSLDALLDHDLTMGLIENITGLGNAFILAKRGNSFIRDWYNGYRQYKNDVWGYNSMELANSLYHRNKSRVHLLTDHLYSPNWFQLQYLINASHPYDWRNNYAMHIWSGKHRLPQSVEDVQTDNSTVGQVFRYILYGDPSPRVKKIKTPLIV